MTTNENTKNKKNAKQKKILVASVVLAGLIVAGGTFAWFTSKDEVTNTLTAKNNYGVEITEDFNPPTNWLPGEEVNKDVSVVNTGNIAAFARVKLSDSIKGTVYGESSDDVNPGVTNVPTNAVTLDDKEVKAIKAGGKLVSAPSGVSTGNVGTEFTVSSVGLYIFERTDNEAAGTKYGQYAGFAYEQSTGKYYALSKITKTGDTYTAKYKEKVAMGTATGGLTTSITVDTTTEIGKAFIKSTFTVDSKTVNAKIYLADNYATNWILGSDGYFYYLKDIKAGTTTPNLVDKVVLDVPTENGLDYAEMNYDLKVNMDSVQVAPGENAKASIPDSWVAKDSISVSGS